MKKTHSVYNVIMSETAMAAWNGVISWRKTDTYACGRRELCSNAFYVRWARPLIKH